MTNDRRSIDNLELLSFSFLDNAFMVICLYMVVSIG